MAFCNSCGAALDPGTRFCNKCGAAITASTPAPAATPAAATPAAPGPVAAAPAPAPTGGSSALKIILIIVAIIVVLGILSVAGVSYFVYHVARSARVHQQGDNVKVETPFGTVETSQDSAKVAKDLGVEIYPGAQPQKNGNSTASFGSIHTVTGAFTTSDSLDKVCDFYKAKFPNAMTTTSDQNRCAIVSNDQNNMITINIEAAGNTTKLQITNVSKKAASSN
jgi:hypothetical protein